MVDPQDPHAPVPFRVLIAGGGVAALETALTLRECAGDAISVQLVTPATAFTRRPLEVRAPFSGDPHVDLDLAALTTAAGATLIEDRLERVNVEDRTITTESEATLPYDALVVAVGSTPRERHTRATTVEPGVVEAQLTELLAEVEAGRVTQAAFIVPARAAWPLPLYELLLSAADALRTAAPEAELTLVTAESAPLGGFGKAISGSVAARLDELGVTVFTSSQAEVPTGEPVEVTRGSTKTAVAAQAVYALPELRGPETPGLPRDQYGFLPVDRFGRVRRSERVFAAGDAADGIFKLGLIASQQADAIAYGVAALALDDVKPRGFQANLASTTRPRLEALLATDASAPASA